MITKSFTKAGTNCNEDSIFICDNYGFVIDGATGLSGEKITPAGSDAQWFSHTLRDYLQTALSYDLPLETILTETLSQVIEDFNKYENAENISIYPSAGISIFRCREDKVEYYVLGDCPALIKTTDNKIYHFTNSNLVKLDSANINLLAKRAKEANIDVINAKSLITDELIKVRELKNKEGGYYILSDDPSAISHGLFGTFDKEDVSEIILMSDGYAQIFELFKAYSKPELFKAIKVKELSEIYDELYALQEEDKSCNKYPRFKLRDDSSAIYANFEKE